MYCGGGTADVPIKNTINTNNFIIFPKKQHKKQ